MLKELSIKNFAIIDDLNIRFSEGFTILSGETGAGKSIIINAVNLLLGARSSSKLIRTGADSAELEALFQVNPASSVARALKENEYGSDVSDELLIRRTIAANDRHRIYINGRLATFQLLNLLTENLASISGQHAHQGLLKEDQQLRLLDQFAGLMPLRDRLSKTFNELLPLVEKLKSLIALQDRQAERLDFLKFKKNEITAAALSPGEDTALENEKSRLKNAEALHQAVYGSIETLYSADGAIAERLTEVKRNLEKAVLLDPELGLAAKGLADISFMIEDVVAELRRYAKSLQTDEGRLEEVEARLDTLQKLKRKYGGSLESVFAGLDAIEQELSEVENLSEKIKQTTVEVDRHHLRLKDLAIELSAKRKKAAADFSRRVVKELASLKMASTEFQVSFRTLPADNKTDRYLTAEGGIVTESGLDRITFMMAPNVGEELRPLSSIASGGELSRVVLALKVILAENDSVETVIFDEVDAGIGGGVAEVVGKKLASLAKYHQVICITHLPQIARFGDHHFKISKQVSKGRTQTIITSLADAERLQEIARMLGGVKITRATIEHATEMLQSKK